MFCQTACVFLFDENKKNNPGALSLMEMDQFMPFIWL